MKSKKIEIKNYINNTKAELIPVDHVLVKADLDRIVEICNQAGVYDMLFRKKFKGRAYEKSDAEGYNKWCIGNWGELLAFPYYIRMKGIGLIGTIDIKSNNYDGAEIGYWVDCNYPGFMSNAVISLSEHAKEQGYRSLYADIKPGNTKSQKVIKNAGFEFQKEINNNEKRKGTYFRFMKEL